MKRLSGENNFMQFLALWTLSLVSFGVLGASVSIGERIQAQKELLQCQESLMSRPDVSLSNEFAKTLRTLPKSSQRQTLDFVKNAEKFIPERPLVALAYWNFVDSQPSQRENVIFCLLKQKAHVLRDFIDSPLEGSSEEKLKARNFLQSLVGPLEGSSSKFRKIARDLAKLSVTDFLSQAAANEFLAFSIKDNLPQAADYSLSYLGFIPGNQVELISYNDTSLERIAWYNDRVMYNGAQLDWSAPYMTMPQRFGKDYDGAGHIAFATDPIFMRIREMIDRAEESIFIDIFLFGGTLGATLSRYLIDEGLKKKAKNPNFRILMLHDFATNYNLKLEMMPVFEYIRDRIKNEPEVSQMMYLLQANIQRHPPGIPFGLTHLIPKTDEVFKFVESMNTYYESKIDHSKVIVIDANGNAPEAYFGSKNWSDHSGGYYYDDAIWVKGPAAAVVQAAYYDDIDAALTTDPQERRWFFFKEQGFGNDHYLPRRSQILKEFQVSRDVYPALGPEVVRIAEANVDGRIKDVRNILVDMILRAESHIYMEQLFLYDKYIIDALIKRKLQKPGLKVKILADHNGNFHLGGIPNTMFLRELEKYGIEVKARKTVGIKFRFPNGEEKEFHQENHRKITSVDGKVLLGGSSNLNPDTLQGSFREFGAQIFSSAEIAKFETYFLEAWSNPIETESFDLDGQEIHLLGKTLKGEAAQVLNDTAATLIRAKDRIERRYR